MAHVDPDQVIGRLAGARLSRATVPRGEVCPDPETLAAYADGGLAPQQVERVDAHLAACPACRRVAAALMPAPAAGGGVAVPAVAGATVLPFPRRPVVVWMSAAAGLLCAVTLWSVYRGGAPSTVSDVALSGTPAAPAAAAAEAEPDLGVAPSAGAGSAAAPRSAVPDGPGPATVARPDAMRQPERASRDAAAAAPGRAKAAPRDADAEAKKLGAAAAASLDDRTRQVTGQRPLAAQTNTVVAGVTRAHGPLAQQANANQQAANVAAPAPAVPAASSPQPASAPAPRPPAAAEAGRERRDAAAPAEESIVTATPDQRAEAAGPAPAPAAGGRGAFARSGERDAGVAFSMGGLAEVSSFAEPDGRLRWRIAGGRRLESSSDGGASWTTRFTAGARLRAGAAPAIDAAWAVGDGGLVLRLTVPGGWAAVTRPADVTLVGVSASSAARARVTAADGRVFETADGGQSWTPVGDGPPAR
jgi:hypothetical protein